LLEEESGHSGFGSCATEREMMPYILQACFEWMSMSSFVSTLLVRGDGRRGRSREKMRKRSRRRRKRGGTTVSEGLDEARSLFAQNLAQAT
jgi:hypothetical protein